MDIPVLFEDLDIVAIDKPSGVIVNRAESVSVATLQDWMDARYRLLWKKYSPHQFPVFFSRSGIAHRLDKETSGVVIAAKTPQSLDLILAQFKSRQVEKTYLALSHGKLPSVSGTIQASVGRLPWNRERFGVLPGGREAETSYTVKRVYFFKKEYYSFLVIFPKTGRTHQIRIHLKHVGHPIVSDSFYAGRKIARSDRIFCPRLFLHSQSITIHHPKTSKLMTIVSPLPKDLDDVLAKMEPVN
ncbi:RluA family pseudouridine synthase [Candidatus Gottesmanbacteria bacterium]|nr:RluA family pseudouridine synthase [Candidatus Gottesmanbacteria bacterium]